MRTYFKNVIKFVMLFALLLPISTIKVEALSHVDSIDFYSKDGSEYKSLYIFQGDKYLLEDYTVSREETENYKVYLDADNNKLYLKNYDYGKIDIYMENLSITPTLEIVLIGDNKLDVFDGTYGIRSNESHFIFNSNNNGNLDINVVNDSNIYTNSIEGISPYALTIDYRGSVVIKGNASLNVNVVSNNNRPSTETYGIKTREFKILDNGNLNLNVDSTGGRSIGIGIFYFSTTPSLGDTLINTNKNINISTKNFKANDAYVLSTNKQVNIDKVNVATFISNNTDDAMFRHNGFNVSEDLEKTTGVDNDITTTVFKSKEPIKVEYTVKFIDHDDTVLKTEIVLEGEGAEAPNNPAREGYTFDGWDCEYDSVNSDLEVRALYTINTYDVVFKDYDDRVIDIQKVEHGSDAIPPLDPTRAGYNFVAWNIDYTNVISTLEVVAIYEKDSLAYTYEIIKGLNPTWNLGNTNDLVIEIDANDEEFLDLEIGGLTLDKSNYEVIAASTIITINADYLNTLKEGTYDVYAIFEENDAYTVLTVKDKVEDEKPLDPNKPIDKPDDTKEEEKTPPTGVNTYTYTFVSMLLISILVFLKAKIRRYN